MVVCVCILSSGTRLSSRVDHASALAAGNDTPWTCKQWDPHWGPSLAACEYSPSSVRSNYRYVVTCWLDLWNARWSQSYSGVVIVSFDCNRCFMSRVNCAQLLICMVTVGTPPVHQSYALLPCVINIWATPGDQSKAVIWLHIHFVRLADYKYYYDDREFFNKQLGVLLKVRWPYSSNHEN